MGHAAKVILKMELYCFVHPTSLYRNAILDFFALLSNFWSIFTV